MSNLKAAFVAALCLALAGCGGFRPLYGKATGVSPALQSVYVEPIADRPGYALRNRLIDLFDSSGRNASAPYRLNVSLSITSQGIALQTDATITRYNDTLVAKYTLTDARGTVLVQDTKTVLASYNVVPPSPNSLYSTLASQQDADDRAAEEIAEQIRYNLASYFAGKRS